MSENIDVTYILQHESGFYVKSTASDIDLTSNRNKAKAFPVNEIRNNPVWGELYSTGEYTVMKRTEVTTIEYEEVERIE